MKIAVIGSGISGLTSAYLLSQQHDVDVYESADRLGGHTATIDIEYQGNPYAIDTGFIVFNNRTYPNFQKLLSQIGVNYQKTDMGFSVSCDNSGLEYSGHDLNTLFAQRKNIFSPQHWMMIKDILRFNKQAPIDLFSMDEAIANTMTLGEYLESHHYSSVFIDKYLIPMGAAIWSASTSVMKQFPLQFFVQFFINHGLLSINNRPQWYVIKGGSKSYIEPLIQSFKDNIRLNTPIASVVRDDEETGLVTIVTDSGDKAQYDHVIIASHSDQALTLLKDPTPEENSVLGNIGYQMNNVVLHTDESLLPKIPLTWSSWNYRIPHHDQTNDQAPPILSYNMNILQGIDAPCTFCVTLNSTDAIDPEKILGSYQYAHPVFTADAIAAQKQWKAINGVKNTWFCGAYWGNGFHEDGVNSALRIAREFGIEW